MRRREFVGVAAASVAALAAPAATIIDTHTHFYDPMRPAGVPWPPKSDALLYRRVLPADFRAVTQGLGVAGTVVVEASPLLEDNQWILDLAKDDRTIVGFIGHLDPAGRDFAAHLRRFGANPLFRGIRLNGRAIAEGLKRPEWIAGLRRMGDAGLTLDAIGDETVFAGVEQIAREVPKLKIVIDHLPFERQRGLPRLPNVYAKVSGMQPLWSRVLLDEVWDAFGPERVVYGSNWPVCERVAPYGEILKVVRDYFAMKGVADAYFRENSKAAYGWVAR